MRRACIAALLGAAGASLFAVQGLVARSAGVTAVSFDGSVTAHHLARTTLISDAAAPLAIGAGTGAAVLVLGYTRCTDRCPLTLATLARALAQMRPRERPRALFLTTDPQYDTPAVLHRYLRAWGNRVVGATASPSAIRAVEAQLGAGLGTQRDHDTRLFLIDAGGDLEGELPADASVDEVRRALSALGGESPSRY